MRHYDELGNTVWAHHKPKRPSLENVTSQTSTADQKAQAADYNTAQGTDSQFEGPVTSSPYYKSLVATSTDATSNAYENAKANSAAKANAAGFGYDSPIGQAASRETQSAEDSALAEIPAKSAAAAAPLSLEASGQTANMGTQLGQEALGYEGQATSLEENYRNAQQDFWKTMFDTGRNAAAGAAGGAKG